MSSQEKKTTNSETTPTASEGYQTPIEPAERKTGVASEDGGKSSAEPESPANSSPVEGAPNQGTEAR
ncbi:MAG: hypothetical protein AAF378_18400 [Cyanobacteria bacterium P01_A01_bin.84]